MPGGVRGAVALVVLAAAIVLAAGADAGAAPTVGSCVQPGYRCVPNGRWREAATNTDERCTWTYNVAWGDGHTSFFVPAPGDEGHSDHQYDVAVHHLYNVVITIPLGFSKDPNVKCTGGRYTHRVEIPGPAINPCVPARGGKPPACYARGIKSGASLLDQVPRLGRSTLDFLLLDDIRTLRKVKTSARQAGQILASYLIPQASLRILDDADLSRLGKKSGSSVLDRLLAAEAKLVTKGDRAAIAPSFRTSSAQDAVTQALLKDQFGHWLGRLDGGVYVVDLTAGRARDLFRQLSRLGQTAVTQRGATQVLLSTLPNGDRAEFTTAGPTMRYFSASSAKWTSFRFAPLVP
ncbi:MAG: hypothetical protein ACJ760_04940 [Thermoleophilaceae bacterium]